MLHREYYIHDRAVASLGLKLFRKEMVSRDISLDEALFMLSSYKLYTSLRKKQAESSSCLSLEDSLLEFILLN